MFSRDALALPMLTPTARFLLACTSPRGLNGQERPQALTAGVDWHALAALTVRHAASPIVHKALSEAPWADVPPGLRQDMRRQARINRLRNTLLVEELARLCGRFEEAGIPLASYKGPVLAQQVYGDIGLRVSTDLDLVIHAWHMDLAMEVMGGLGYRFIPLRGQRHDRPARENLRRWHCCNFAHQGASVAVDLHARFAPAHFPVAATLETFATRLERCTIGEHAFLGFAREDQLVLLAMHAGKDLMWRRLAWFSEIAKLVAAPAPLDWDRVFETARQMGCRWVLLQSLLLVHRLYGTAVPCHRYGAAHELARLQRRGGEIVRRLFEPPAGDAPLEVHFIIHPALRERWRDRWHCYVGGLRALAKYLEPPPSERARSSLAPVSAWLRYPDYWARSAFKVSRRWISGVPGATRR